MSVAVAHVWVDGSLREGRGGIGMSGAFGARCRSIRCATSWETELAAIAWAMDMGLRHDTCHLVVHSDFVFSGYLRCFVRKKHSPLTKLLAYAIHRVCLMRPAWLVTNASGREVKAAHLLARRGSAPHGLRELVELPEMGSS